MQSLVADSRYALRTLAKAPSTTTFAVAALALGIGASTAIFSLFDAVLLRPMKFRDPARLVEVFEDNSALGFPRNTPAPANVADWKQRNHVFTDLAAENQGILNITGSGAEPEEVENAEITANLFPLLGVRPILGRDLRLDECRTVPARVVIISYGVWQRRFSGATDAIGKTIELDREPFTVIGVMPRGFSFPEKVDLWRPTTFRLDGTEALPRDNHYLHVYARLKRGIGARDAAREMQGIAAQLRKDYPQSNANLGTVVIGLQDEFVGDLKLRLFVLVGGVGTLLLIACANVASLSLARASGRQRELAVRAALGATRFDLVRQSLFESLLLAFAGGTLGTILADWSLPLLRQLVPAAMTDWAQPEINSNALLLTFGISILCAIMSGIFPALTMSRIDLRTALQQGGRGGIAASSLTRSILVGGEVGLATVLLVGALLLGQTLWNLSRVPLGFQPGHVLAARTSIPLSPQSPYRTFEARTRFYTRVLDQVSVIPGVESAGYTTFLPLTNRGGTMGFRIEGRPAPRPGESPDANARVVTPNYLQTMRDVLETGRYFNSSDRVGSQGVVIVNETMARKFWPGENALGKRLRIGDEPQPWLTIVGIVENVRQMGLDVEGRAEMYFPYTQEATAVGYFTPRDLAVRVSGDPVDFADSIRKAVWAIDPSQPVINVQPMQALVDEELAAREIQVTLICAFAGIALVLAALGLYGLLAFTVLQRVPEIGLRMAVGADRSRVVRGILQEGMRLTLSGLVVGSAVAWFVARIIKSLFFGVSSGNPLTFVVAAGVLITASGIACYFPARAAASVDPMVALRND